MRIAILILVGLNFISFFWSVIGVFKKVPNQDTRGYRMLQLNSVLIWLWGLNLILNSEPPVLWASVTLLAIQLFCLITFWILSRIVKRNNFSLAFSRDIPETLVTYGLYKKVRHPFYMIYLLCYFSIAVFYLDAILFALSTVMTFIYYRAAKLEENKFLNSPLAAQYRDYQARTFMFLPKLWN